MTKVARERLIDIAQRYYLEDQHVSGIVGCIDWFHSGNTRHCWNMYAEARSFDSSLRRAVARAGEVCLDT